MQPIRLASFLTIFASLLTVLAFSTAWPLFGQPPIDPAEASPAEASPAEEPASSFERLEALATDERPASERFQELVDLFYEIQLEEYPELATSLDEPVRGAPWTDLSTVALRRRDRQTARALDILRGLDPATLGAAARLDYDLLEDALARAVARQRFSGEVLVITQLEGIQQSAPDTLDRMPRRTVADVEAMLERLEALPRLVDQTLVLLNRGLQSGVTPPRVTLRDVPAQVLALIPEDPWESPLLGPWTELPERLPEAERERLRARAAEIFAAAVRPAFEKLHRFLTVTYLPGVRTTIAMDELPDGAAWYALKVRDFTTTEKTPQEIHQLGLSEVKRIRDLMAEAIAATGFRGDESAFAEILRTHPDFYVSDEDALLAAYRDAAKRADAQLPRFFSRLPRLPYGVEAMPEQMAKSAPSAYYVPGSLDAGRSATFYVNTFDLASRPTWRIESLTLHEAVPGHHLQLALAQEQEALPWFRRLGGVPAYAEGWALYAEGLGEAMGLYDDPYDKIGALTSELWRALRLVVDTGIHAFGWSRQQAISYLTENTARPEHEIIVEVDRYIVWPGQALAYKVGELKIRELRTRAEEALGEAFDLRAFHDAVLAGGAMPLSILERQIDAWIAGQLGELEMAQP